MNESNQTVESPSTKQLLAEIDDLHQRIATLEASNASLLVSKLQLDAFFDNAPVKLYLKDRDGRYLRLNKKFESIFDVKSEDMIGLLPWDLHDHEAASIARERDVFVLNTGKTVSFESTVQYVGDQQPHTLLTVKFPVYNDKKEIDGIGAIVTDLTEIKQMEDTLRRMQKMDAVGHMTGGIAHDFNNILSVVMGNLELIKEQPEICDKTRIWVNAALMSTSHGADLTRKLINFSRTTAELTTPIKLNKALNNMEVLIAKALSLSSTTDFKLADDLWVVNIDPGDFEDAIINLLLNARDAIAEDGVITIRTSNVEINENSGHDCSQVPAGDYVEISVLDNGHGMSDEVIKKAIDPFFTTKTPDKGSGLGLSMVYAFAKRSGGYMRISSDTNKGTEVAIYIPRYLSDHDEDAVPHISLMPNQGNETILIVEDEIALAEVAVAYLQSMGYRTLVAYNSTDALDILSAHSKVDLLFTDVIMPGEMDGYVLASKARCLFPTIKVLLTSGLSKNVQNQTIINKEPGAAISSRLLQKPYSKLDLSHAIHKALNNDVLGPDHD